ncbi:hypothetical protein F0L68_27890 [Solihabitans fulvus]|uniref:Uncharacterized protein n=1 Tax=Solihabitans fulvus TaxID=1892852 RepID=A0A5B2WYK1_9PSEU|nr:hypothetical protein [Solihabitans fulvus]KAA2256000.1 hypothetical protein F0L68_27890 [Solihabitans fulvus]
MGRGEVLLADAVAVGGIEGFGFEGGGEFGVGGGGLAVLEVPVGEQFGAFQEFGQDVAGGVFGEG